MRLSSKLITALLLALLTACGTSPTSHYYMLSADAQGSPGQGGPSLGVGPVTIPEYLARREMVLNRGAHRVELAGFDRWAEPLDAGVSRVVAVNLASLLNTQSVQSYPWPRDSVPQYAVRLGVTSLTMQDNEARLVCEWTITRAESAEVVNQRISEFSTAGNSEDPETVAAAYSQLLLRLSREIAGEIESDRKNSQ